MFIRSAGSVDVLARRGVTPTHEGHMIYTSVQDYVYSYLHHGALLLAAPTDALALTGRLPARADWPDHARGIHSTTRSGTARHIRRGYTTEQSINMREAATTHLLQRLCGTMHQRRRQTQIKVGPELHAQQ